MKCNCDEILSLLSSLSVKLWSVCFLFSFPLQKNSCVVFQVIIRKSARGLED